MINNKSIKRGSIVLCDLPITETSVQGNLRPAVVISNDIANTHSPVVSIVPLTGTRKKYLPVHTILESTARRSIALCEQLTTISKSSIIKILGVVQDDELRKIEQAVKVQLAI